MKTSISKTSHTNEQFIMPERHSSKFVKSFVMNQKSLQAWLGKEYKIPLKPNASAAYGSIDRFQF